MRRLNQATGIAQESRPLMRALAPGSSMTIVLPETRFWRGQTYRNISAAAHSLWGTGAYALDGVTIPGSMIVTRLAHPRDTGEFGRDAARTRTTMFHQRPFA